MTTQTKLTLRKKLLRLARTQPALRPRILNLVGRLAITNRKVAVSQDTKDFTSWVESTQEPMDVSEVRSFVERRLGIKTSAPAPKRSGDRFQKGDQVYITKDKHVDRRFDSTPYENNHGAVGVVTEIDGQDALVAFKSKPAPIRFPGALMPRGVGIYKYTPPVTIQGSPKFEMIYYTAHPPREDAVVTVKAYLRRAGRRAALGAEDIVVVTRSPLYHSGYVFKASVGKNGWYFSGFPQQRLTVDSTGQPTEAGNRPTSYNPATGKIMYIGLLNQRPPQWKDELAELRAAAGESED